MQLIYSFPIHDLSYGMASTVTGGATYRIDITGTRADTKETARLVVDFVDGNGTPIQKSGPNETRAILPVDDFLRLRASLEYGDNSVRIFENVHGEMAFDINMSSE